MYSSSIKLKFPIQQLKFFVLYFAPFILGGITTLGFSPYNFTIINFWASWCTPCRKEHKYLVKLSKNKNVKILGINFKDEKSKANEFLKELEDPFYLKAFDNKGKTSVSFGVYGIPETIIIDNFNYEELIDLYEILEKDDDIIFKWYSDENENNTIKKNKVSKLLKDFKFQK